jgi:hypothetical protein
MNSVVFMDKMSGVNMLKCLSFSFGVLYLQLLEAAQSLSLSLTKSNKNDLETDGDKKGKEDKTGDASKLESNGEGTVVTHEMDPDEV